MEMDTAQNIHEAGLSGLRAVWRPVETYYTGKFYRKYVVSSSEQTKLSVIYGCPY